MYQLLLSRGETINLASIILQNNHKFKQLSTSWMFRESFPFIGACIVDAFDINWFTNFQQAWNYLHLPKQRIIVSL